MVDKYKLESLYNSENIACNTFTLPNGETISTKVNVDLFRYIHDNLIKYEPNQSFGYFRPENVIDKELTKVGICEELIDITLDYKLLAHYMGSRFYRHEIIKKIVQENSHSVKWRHNTFDLELGLSLPVTTIPYSLYIKYKDFKMVSLMVQETIDKITGVRKNIVKKECILDYDLISKLHDKKILYNKL